MIFRCISKGERYVLCTDWHMHIIANSMIPYAVGFGTAEVPRSPGVKLNPAKNHHVHSMASRRGMLLCLLRHNLEVRVPTVYIGPCDLLLRYSFLPPPISDCLGWANCCALASCKTNEQA